MRNDIWLALTISLVFLLIGCKFGQEIGKAIRDQELIERGVKHYDLQTGELVWKEEE